MRASAPAMIGAIVESAATEANRLAPSAANARAPAANANSPVIGGRPIRRAVASCPGSAIAVSTNAATASRGSRERLYPWSEGNSQLACPPALAMLAAGCVAFLLLRAQRRMIFAADFRDVDARRRQLQAHLVHGVGDDLGDCQIAKPLVIGWNDEPGRVLGAGLFHRVLVCRDVFRPQLALGIVAFADLPMSRRIVQALREARELFFRTDVQIEFQDARAVLDQHFLEIVDQVVTLGPDRARNQVMNAYHEDILVVRAIENRDLPLRRSAHMDAPQKIVRAFDLARLLEPINERSLRIDAAEYVTDHAVFPGRVERLQDDQQ